MKRKILITVGAIVILASLFAAFNWNPRLVPQKKTYPEGTQTVTAVWKGISLFGKFHGNPFTLERLEKGEWVNVDETGGIAFELPAYSLFHGKKSDYHIGIYAKNITAGQYRIVTDMYSFKTGEKTTMYCEFEIK